MKKTLSYILLLIISFVTLMSCKDREDTPNKEVLNAFEREFPGATSIEWDRSGSYYKAEFRKDGKKTSAYFEPTGQLVMTEIKIYYQDLPDLVKASFEKSEYFPSYASQADDITKLLRVGAETLYVIEIDRKDQPDVDLYYTADGILVKTLFDGEKYSSGENTGGGSGGTRPGLTPQVLPAAITTYMTQKYPGYRLLEYDLDRKKQWDIEIQHQQKQKDLLFTEAGVWISTKWDILVSEIPTVVKEKLQAEHQTDGYTYKAKDGADAIELPNQTELCYGFELEKAGSIDRYIILDANGLRVN